jgi:phosphohistidine swiveling domain-containing protein
MSRGELVQSSGEWSPDDSPARLGSKAAGLLELERLGLPVPDFACVTTELWDELVERLPSALRDELELPPDDLQKLADAGARARELITGFTLDASAVDCLMATAREVAGDLGAVSVRSSALGEDSAQASFAGQFDSDLWVAVEDVPDRVLRCLASAFSDRALLYRRAHGLGVEASRMAIVIQRMIDTAAAGIVFTRDPLVPQRERECAVIVAGLGLGEGVVSGSVATDTFRVDADERIVERELATKSTRVVRTVGVSGTTLEQVPPEQAGAPALDDEQVLAVARLARFVAERRGAAQDVEWALGEDDRIWLLQARPITTEAPGRETVFDNSNLVESFPGVTSPLTFSIMRRAYEHNLRGLVEEFGLERSDAELSGYVYENLVGSLSGHMYYNLSNWYQMFLLIPGLERAVPAFESAMGFAPTDSLESKSLSTFDKLRWLPGQIRVATRIARAFVTMRSRVRVFQATHARLASEQRDLALRQMDAHDLLARVEKINRELFWQMSVAPINDFFTQQLFAALGGLLRALGVPDPDRLRNDLLCGESEMESVAPVRSLVRLAEEIDDHDRARTLLASPLDALDVLDKIDADARCASIRDALHTHIERFGHRSLDELKLEASTLRDEPAPLIEILRNLLRANRTVETMEDHERATRARADAEVRRCLSGRPLRRAVLLFVLARCREGLKSRESMRLTRGSVVAMLRDCYRALGGRFVERRLLERREQIFLLTAQEIADSVNGAAVNENLAALAALRGEELARAADSSIPARISTRGIVLASERSDRAHERATDGALIGVGCAAGRVRAKAMVVEQPRADLRVDGEVLVARTTDPGWVFLMIAAGGLVSEQGNMLSHTAIIGRELGIPTVVGIREATKRLAGDVEVELDGAAGTVSIVDQPG